VVNNEAVAQRPDVVVEQYGDAVDVLREDLAKDRIARLVEVRDPHPGRLEHCDGPTAHIVESDDDDVPR